MEEETIRSKRAAAMNIWYVGADGVYTFNFFPTKRDERFDQLGSLQTLKGLDKVYCVDRMAIEKFPPKSRWALVAPDRLPISLELDGGGGRKRKKERQKAEATAKAPIPGWDL